MVSSSVCNVIPLKSRGRSNLPLIGGGRLDAGEGDAGVGIGISTGSARIASRCQRSSEIQRIVMAPNNAKKMTSTMRHSVFRRSFCTELFPQPGYNCGDNAQHA